ncbi:MAG: rhodanese-like domain-containing protein [Burkholderiales bacterium]
MLDVIVDTAADAPAAHAADSFSARDAGVPPAEAWRLVASGAARLLDVRTAEERSFVGRPPESVHVPWATGTRLTRNPRFVREVERAAGREGPLLVLSRGTARARQAVEALRRAGRADVAVVLEGFEGTLDADGRRGLADGWRRARLPWSQD